MTPKARLGRDRPPEAGSAVPADFELNGRGQWLGFYGEVDAYGPVHSGLGRVIDRGVSHVWVCGCQFRGGGDGRTLVRVGPAELDLELLGFERDAFIVTGCSPAAPQTPGLRPFRIGL